MHALSAQRPVEQEQRNHWRPVWCLAGLMVYCLTIPFISPDSFTRARPGGPLLSVLGQLVPGIWAGVGIVLGVIYLRHQSRGLKAATAVLMLLATGITGLAITMAIDTHHMTWGRWWLFGI